MKKKIFVSLLLNFEFFLLNSSFSQSLQDAVKLTESEQFEKASDAYISLIQREPGNGDNYFFYGENFFKEEVMDSSFKTIDLDSALALYEKGLKKNPSNPLNYIGIGKVFWYNEKFSEAKKQFYDAIQIMSPINKSSSFTGKQKALAYRKIAECYTKAPNKDLQEAINLLNKALKEEPNNPETYILIGDATLEQNPGDASQAITYYKKAYELDKKSSRALLRIGQLYSRARNLSEAVKHYDEAINVDPGFAPAYREKAEAYYKGRQYETAILNYKKYLELNSGSISARVRYASFLFLSKKYNETITEIEEVIKQNSSIPFLCRLLAYSYFELGDNSISLGMDKLAVEQKLGKPKSINTTVTKGRTMEQWVYDNIYLYFENGKLDSYQTLNSASINTSSSVGNYANGLIAMEQFFLKIPDKKVLASDYEYYGKLLSKSGNDSLAIVKLKQAIEKDTGKTELWGEIGNMYMKIKKYPETIDAFLKKVKGGKEIEVNDYYVLGRAYYYSKDCQKADSAFMQIIALRPDIPTGYLWRAKANTCMDPESKNGLAQPFYEEFLSKLKPDEIEKNKNNVIEANEYLGYYYMLQKDYAKAKCNWQKVKELSPNHEKAKKALAEPNVAKAKCQNE